MPPPRGDAHDSADPLDHHPPGLVDRCSDQRDPNARPAPRDPLDPFGAGAGLAEAPAGKHQPGPPASLLRWKLAVMRPAFEIGVVREQVACAHVPDDPALLVGRSLRQRAVQLAR
jgi:hypothetical protein